MSNQFQLLKEQRFRPFFNTQFLGAFNDNVFKTALITLVAFHAASLTSMNGKTLATILPGVFILPFFMFSATAGQIADKFEKSRIMRFVKVLEIAIMLVASAGFYWHNIWLLGCSLFMMGVHSALFGPVKYAYLPQHLRENELIGGNGMVEMGSFVAILLGQVLGAWLANKGSIIIGLTIISIAILGYFCSRSIPNSPAADASLKINWNIVTETWRNLKYAWRNQTIWLALVAISWFWFYGAILLSQFPVFARDVLHGDESVFILLLSIFSLGIGVGSLGCENLAKGKVELGLVLFGAIGMAIFGFDFARSSSLQASSTGDLLTFSQFLTGLVQFRLVFDIAALGVFAGFYIVPLYALIQTIGEKSHQSRTIAANNILNALFMVASVGFAMLIFSLNYTIVQLFMATVVLHVLVIAYLCWRQPEYLSAFKIWVKK